MKWYRHFFWLTVYYYLHIAFADESKYFFVFNHTAMIVFISWRLCRFSFVFDILFLLKYFVLFCFIFVENKPICLLWIVLFYFDFTFYFDDTLLQPLCLSLNTLRTIQSKILPAWYLDTRILRHCSLQYPFVSSFLIVEGCLSLAEKMIFNPKVASNFKLGKYSATALHKSEKCCKINFLCPCLAKFYFIFKNY